MTSPLPALATVALFALAALSGCSGKAEGVNTAPTADLAVTPGDAPNLWLLDGSKSVDPDGDQLTYHWNWLLGNATTTEPKIQVEFPAAAAKGNASYPVSLVVRDRKGEPALALGAVKFGQSDNRFPTIALNDGPRWVKPNVEITVDASPTTDPEGDPLAYEWLWGPRGSFDVKQTLVPDACLESDSRLSTFSTGCLEKGQAYNLTFDQAGTFDIHCHPHPWMQARIVVDASAPAAPVTYRIADFAYPEKLMTIGLGSTVTFVNDDPVAHTATVLDWLPGTKSGGNTPIFKQTLSEGEYVLRLIVTDAKGGRATKSWGLKVSADAPANPQVKTYNSTAPVVPERDWKNGFYNLSYDAMITAVMTWDDPTNALFLGNFSVEEKALDGTMTPQPQCIARPDQGLAGEPGALRMVCLLKAGNYVFTVAAERDGDPGFLGNFNLGISGVVRTKAGFGDSATCVMHAGHCH
jgi:plastocyanin